MKACVLTVFTCGTMLVGCAPNSIMGPAIDEDGLSLPSKLVELDEALELTEDGFLVLNESKVADGPARQFLSALVLFANNPENSARYELKEDQVSSRISSFTEDEESDLDVIVVFTGSDWDRVKREARQGRASWAYGKVITQLLKYKLNPQNYFASQPRWATRGVSFQTRIQIEIIGHVFRGDGDNEMRFSEWWAFRSLWD